MRDPRLVTPPPPKIVMEESLPSLIETAPAAVDSGMIRTPMI
jgi:hypothetical protein